MVASPSSPSLILCIWFKATISNQAFFFFSFFKRISHTFVSEWCEFWPILQGIKKWNLPFTFRLSIIFLDLEIAGAEVRVGHSDTYRENELCGVVEEEQARAGAYITVTCDPHRCGRYISIHQDEGDRILTLCEVWAYSALPQPTIGKTLWPT